MRDTKPARFRAVIEYEPSRPAELDEESKLLAAEFDSRWWGVKSIHVERVERKRRVTR